ncbi:pleckstrin domain-containing protein [Trypanosoma theileri]|uniref:Pleckstrin domain-containing protein n=1 Tax=Trypanosoma theileri TaxID=67003 RepID=A0A1X0NT83_9TRYP|nr:pleckstrin domain-containing protein [Trypanosoma theileri]ORC87399.1 pleckstrin domain-containing protein [Trypanosoma theileri]
MSGIGADVVPVLSSAGAETHSEKVQEEASTNTEDNHRTPLAPEEKIETACVSIPSHSTVGGEKMCDKPTTALGEAKNDEPTAVNEPNTADIPITVVGEAKNDESSNPGAKVEESSINKAKGSELPSEIGSGEKLQSDLHSNPLQEGSSIALKPHGEVKENTEKVKESEFAEDHSQGPTLQDSSFSQSVKDSSNTVEGKSSTDASNLRDVDQQLQGLGKMGYGSVLTRYLTMGSVVDSHSLGNSTTSVLLDDKHQHVDPHLRDSLLQAAKHMYSRQRYPNKQIFRRKLVLLGHQEVGKTSLRKCFESEPYFFKRLPDVKTTTGVEVRIQSVRVGNDHVQLVFSDFAGQEAYHSNSLFLTDRSIFLLVWKISAVEQDFQSSGISASEEQRLYKWIAEVYAKYPRAKVALVATHLDELRVQGQRSVERILSKVEDKIMGFMRRIAVVDPNTGLPITNEIIGNFAVSCKGRYLIAAGGLRHLSGGKISALLHFFAEVAHKECVEDIDFPSAGIPGRHIRLIDEVTEKKKRFPQKILMPLGEFVHSAVQFGVESDTELLQIARLMQSWNMIYLFNSYRLSENTFIILHPLWLSRLAAALFSYAHVLHTPLHLRSIIGGLEYTVSQAEAADMHLMSKGFLRWPLVRILFRLPLQDALGREPDDSDFKMAMQLLTALNLLYPVDVPCDELAILQEETPIDPEQGHPILNEHKVIRYFVPSLSPYDAPNSLKKLSPILFNRGAKVMFEFNLLPNEMWWRLQAQLHQYLQVIVLHEPHSVLAEEKDENVLDDYRLFEADDEHNRWNDAMWLRGDNCRVFLYREGLHAIRIFSTETESRGAEEVLEVIERLMTDLLEEYQGVQRTVRVACPVPSCDGWLAASDVAAGTTVTCPSCKEVIESKDILASGLGSRGSRQFSDSLLKEAGELLYLSLNRRGCLQVCEYLGIPCRVPDKMEVSNTDNEMNTPMDQHLDYAYALDKVVRVALLRHLRERVEEEARRRRMLEHAPAAFHLSY